MQRNCLKEMSDKIKSKAQENTSAVEAAREKEKEKIQKDAQKK